MKLFRGIQELVKSRELVLADFGPQRAEVEDVLENFSGDAKYTILFLLIFARFKGKAPEAIGLIKGKLIAGCLEPFVPQGDWLKYLTKREINALYEIYQKLGE